MFIVFRCFYASLFVCVVCVLFGFVLDFCSVHRVIHFLLDLFLHVFLIFVCCIWFCVCFLLSAPGHCLLFVLFGFVVSCVFLSFCFVVCSCVVFVVCVFVCFVWFCV